MKSWALWTVDWNKEIEYDSLNLGVVAVLRYNGLSEGENYWFVWPLVLARCFGCGVHKVPTEADPKHCMH